ncbi:hypothetical protein CONLIGDRAFT_640654 [Coniochaeta ligniaria NRRL 30616]|uniref:Uncharacterized protein n=1 Tax=Coniochaeta ligniaria NRRL 30616 TaxID=1408157 RepID=A0A1J7K097_9PEZI|nr:hypothetical protein CONLIGDRAFT_640654 [Coniochaeta ligniaria NRRL 30616]
MASNSSTPVKVPSSAASYTPATLDPDLRSQINTLLIKDGHINKIQDHLLHTLNAHPTNWPTAIQSHALSLLRSGEVTTFPALVRRVMDDVRHQTATAGPSQNNGVETTNGKKEKQQHVNGNNGAAESEDKQNLALPQAVVEDALRVTRESLEMVCEIEGDGT